MNVHGWIPARMQAHRFPGKPLALIHGKPMIQWVYERAVRWEGWDTLAVATCDREIADACQKMSIPCDWTRADHTRALDRVAEAAQNAGASANDCIVCVQGDEPMVTVDLIRAVTQAVMDREVDNTVLCMPIRSIEEMRDPNIVKVVTDSKDFVRYTSRSPIPYCPDDRVPDIAIRIGGMFAWTKAALDGFIATPPHPLELYESCDSNRINGNGRRQKAIRVPWRPYYSVDVPEDIGRVENAGPL